MGWPQYLAHLAIVLLIVREVGWDLGRAEEHMWEAEKGARHHCMQTPEQGGAGGGRAGGLLCHGDSGGQPHPYLGNTRRYTWGWGG